MQDVKVTIISSMPPVKGISHYTVELVNELAKIRPVEVIGFRDIYPEFLYPGGTKDTETNEPMIDNVEIRSVVKWYSPWSWLKAAFSVKSTIVHAQWWSYVLAPIYITLLLVSKIKRKKIIITYHNVKPHEKNLLSQLANRVIVYFADHVIVHSRRGKDIIVNNYKLNEAKVSVVPLGSYSTHGRPVEKRIAQKKLHLEDRYKYLLFFGNIRSYKGLEVMLQALDIIRKQKSSVKLIVAGKPWGDWDRYQHIINELKLEDNLQLVLKYLPDNEMDLYFWASDIVVLPYKHFDSQSAVGGASLGYGKPMVVSDAGGLPDLVKNKRAVHRADDPNDLANKLLDVLSDKDLLRKLADDSKELSQLYSWKNISKQTVEIYDSVARR